MPSDCPLGYHAVPSGANGTACSGRGLPVAAQGVCQCFVGYEGPACGGCADGYWPAGGLCQRTIGSFQAEAALAGRNALLIPATAPAPAPAAAAKVPPFKFYTLGGGHARSGACCTLLIGSVTGTQSLICRGEDPKKEHRLANRVLHHHLHNHSVLMPACMCHCVDMVSVIC